MGPLLVIVLFNSLGVERTQWPADHRRLGEHYARRPSIRTVTVRNRCAARKLITVCYFYKCVYNSTGQSGGGGGVTVTSQLWNPPTCQVLLSTDPFQSTCLVLPTQFCHTSIYCLYAIKNQLSPFVCFPMGVVWNLMPHVVFDMTSCCS